MPAVTRGGLYIRPTYDVQAAADTDAVAPGDGGLSTVPGDPLLLPQSFRPRSLGGTGRHPVWSIDSSRLPPYELCPRSDRPNHTLIETAIPTELATFQSNIARTAHEWGLAGD